MESTFYCDSEAGGSMQLLEREDNILWNEIVFRFTPSGITYGRNPQFPTFQFRHDLHVTIIYSYIFKGDEYFTSDEFNCKVNARQ